MYTVNGYISHHDGAAVTVVTETPVGPLVDRYEATRVSLGIDDGRLISNDQRRKIYATFRDISQYTGHLPEETKEIMKYMFIEKTGVKYFSLSSIDMTGAKMFLQFLIDFCLEWDIPTSENLIDRCPDTARYLYKCLWERKCCICGKSRADMHHTDAVGMGRDRREIDHEGMRAMPLCRRHHGEAHNAGQTAFDAKYKVFGIKIDRALASKLKL